MDGPAALTCVLDPTLAPGYIGWVANDGETLHLGVAGYGSRFEPRRSLARLRARLAGRVVDLTHGRLVERRGGLIPVNGVLERIGCAHGLLIGDAAGAVSPLTAGGLDGCMRLTAVAAGALDRALREGTTSPVAAYSGMPYRARFATRRALRRVLANVRSPAAAELLVVMLRLPVLRALARQIYFGRGSFPDARSGAVARGRGVLHGERDPVPLEVDGQDRDADLLSGADDAGGVLDEVIGEL